MAKICIDCGEDCSDKPRVRDTNGRYCCKVCYGQRQARAEERRRLEQDDAALQAEDTPVAVASAYDQGACPVCAWGLPQNGICPQCRYNRAVGLHTSNRIRKRLIDGIAKPICAECTADMTGLRTTTCPDCGGSAEVLSAPDDLGPVPIDEPDAPLGMPLDAPRSEEAQACPVCFRRIPGDVKICGNCQYNVRVGLGSSHLVRKTMVDGVRTVICQNCKYDLSRVPSMTCPECGTTAELAKERGRFNREESRRQARLAYMHPLIMVGIWFVVLCVAGAIVADPMGIVLGVAGMAIMSVLSTIAYALACMLWMGWDAPLHLTAIRFAGILSVFQVSLAVIGLILPIPLVPLILSLGIMFMTMQRLLEIDFGEAVLIWLMTGAIAVGASIAIGMLV